MKIVWHVNNRKILHEDPAMLTDILKHLTKRFGIEASLNISCRDVHEYLGMTLDYSEQECVKINMKDYIASILDEVPASMEGTTRTPTSSRLFQVCKTSLKLERTMLSSIITSQQICCILVRKINQISKRQYRSSVRECCIPTQMTRRSSRKL